MRTRTELTEGSIQKGLLLYFLPIVAGTLLHQLYNTVDALVVGKYVGTEALAAVGGSAAHIIQVINGFFSSLSGGAAVVLAQYYGAKDDEAVEQSAHTAVAFCALCGLALTLLGTLTTPWMLRVLRTTADSFADATLYLRIYFCGTAFVLLFNIASAILRAVGDSRSSFRYLALCCLCNIALDFFFVLGLRAGVAGVAWATVISQALSAALCLGKLARAKGAYALRLRRLRLHGRILRRMLRIGLPAGLQSSMYSVSNLILQVGFNTLGTVVVASWTMTGKIDGVYWAISNAVGVALMNFVGQNYGAGKYDRVRASARVGLRLFFAVTLVLSAAILAAAPPLLRVLTDDPAVRETANAMLWQLAPFYFVFTFIEVLNGTLRGVGDTLVPFAILGVGICALRLVWLGTAFVANPTARTLCYCFPISWTVSSLAIAVYYLWFSRVKKMPASNSGKARV